jgi:hypothetical protein
MGNFFVLAHMVFFLIIRLLSNSPSLSFHILIGFAPDTHHQVYLERIE